MPRDSCLPYQSSDSPGHSSCCQAEFLQGQLPAAISSPGKMGQLIANCIFLAAACSLPSLCPGWLPSPTPSPPCSPNSLRKALWMSPAHQPSLDQPVPDIAAGRAESVFSSSHCQAVPETWQSSPGRAPQYLPCACVVQGQTCSHGQCAHPPQHQASPPASQGLGCCRGDTLGPAHPAETTAGSWEQVPGQP